jgi:hypothetical protein
MILPLAIVAVLVLIACHEEKLRRRRRQALAAYYRQMDSRESRRAPIKHFDEERRNPR